MYDLQIQEWGEVRFAYLDGEVPVGQRNCRVHRAHRLLEGVGECEVVGDEPGPLVEPVAHDVVTGHRVDCHQHVDRGELLAVLGLTLLLTVVPQLGHRVQHLATKKNKTGTTG